MRKSNVNSLIRQFLALKFFKNYHNYKEKKKKKIIIINIHIHITLLQII